MLRSMRVWVVCVVVAAGTLVAAAGGAEALRRATTSTTSSTTAASTNGPAAALTPLTGGEGLYIGRLGDDKVAGYVEHEYAASGTAASYTPQGELGGDGRWSFVASPGGAPYRTRVIVRRPKRASDFSGNVVVEWLNVSPGVDNEPEWANSYEELTRSGDVWVGVSAQKIGVEGGPIAVKVEGIPGAEDAGKGLKTIDPVRYGSLQHPGDGYSLDIFSQVTRAVREGTGLDGLHPRKLIGAGQSQSAAAMVTYINGVQPIDKLFDGFFLHSRFSVGLPLFGAVSTTGIADALRSAPTIIRTDLGVPVFDVQTETDVVSIVNSAAVRQDDTADFRLWEVAGTAHADVYQMGEANAAAMNCGVPVNDGPMHVVVKAAMHELVRWVDTGTPPPKAPRLELTSDASPTIARDADGVALGGVRTPPVDVPVAVLSGAQGPNPSTICLLLGSTAPMPSARIAELYHSRTDYLQRYRKAAQRAIAAGYVLAPDRAALLAFADPEKVAG